MNANGRKKDNVREYFKESMRERWSEKNQIRSETWNTSGLPFLPHSCFVFHIFKFRSHREYCKPAFNFVSIYVPFISD